jgi:tetratricopeptide (TPR) repeat protein
MDQSRETYEQAAGLFEKLTSEYPHHAPPYRELALAQYQLGKIAWGAQQGDKALALYKAAFATFQKFLQKASLEQPQPPVPMGAANLSTLASIVRREAETAAATGRRDLVAAAWTRLIKVTDTLPTDRLTEAEAAEVADLRGNAVQSAYQAFIQMETVPDDQADNLRSVLIEMARSNPEVTATEQYSALQKRLESR